jgi:hypothetical protein
MKKRVYTIATICLLSSTAFKNDKIVNQVKGRDFVPDEKTAIKVAEAIWLPIFGEDIYDEKPFVAHLVKNVWYVSGSLKPGEFGGVAMIEIRKSDCKILSVSHPK